MWEKERGGADFGKIRGGEEWGWGRDVYKG